jgi:hypothetical protein
MTAEQQVPEVWWDRDTNVVITDCPSWPTGTFTPADLVRLVPADAPALPAPASGVTIQATTYHVSVLPESAPDSDMWDILVELRGHGRWSVRHFSKSLGRDGTWSYGPRDDEDATAWVVAHRFGLDEALHLAAQHAPNITVNGVTPAQQLARTPMSGTHQ